MSGNISQKAGGNTKLIKATNVLNIMSLSNIETSVNKVIYSRVLKQNPILMIQSRKTQQIKSFGIILVKVTRRLFGNRFPYTRQGGSWMRARLVTNYTVTIIVWTDTLNVASDSSNIHRVVRIKNRLFVSFPEAWL